MTSRDTDSSVIQLTLPDVYLTNRAIARPDASMMAVGSPNSAMHAHGRHIWLNIDADINSIGNKDLFLSLSSKSLSPRSVNMNSMDGTNREPKNSPMLTWMNSLENWLIGSENIEVLSETVLMNCSNPAKQTSKMVKTVSFI